MRQRRCTIGKTTLSIHPATALLLLTGVLSPMRTQLLWAMLSVLLHEGAHAVTAFLLHAPPQELEITPLGALMRLEEEERLPAMKRGSIILAGPCMTLMLCLLAFRLTQRGVLPLSVGRSLFLANAALLCINLLPALPLDGGRLLSLLLGRWLRREVCWRVMRLLGSLLGLALLALGVWTALRHGQANLSLAAAGCFLLYSASGATTTHAMAELRDFMDRKIRLEEKGMLPGQVIVALETRTLRQAVSCLHPSKMSLFCLVAEGTMNRRALLSEQQVIAAYLAHPQGTLGQAVPEEATET